MDIRVEKTKRSIINAFLALRGRKPLEKITVKELCALAIINKSTFYDHYRDIYDLSDQLETEVVSSVLAGLSGPERLLEEPEAFTRELFLGYLSQDRLIQTLFSGNQSGHLASKIEAAVKEMLFETYPQYRDNPEANVRISCCVYGGYHAFFENRKYGEDAVIRTLGKIAAETVRWKTI